MISKNLALDRTIVNRVLSKKQTVRRGTLLPVITQFLKKKSHIRAILKKQSTPLYIFDEGELTANINRFADAFHSVLSRQNVFYAVKSNPHPFILKTAVRRGINLDVSSGRELKAAVAANSKKILFTGPGKTEAELQRAISLGQKITINIDSFNELKLLGAITNKSKRGVRAGVRINTASHGQWNKFGIPIAELKTFWQRAKEYPWIKLEGIHFHNSWCENAEPYANTLATISKTIANADSTLRRQLKFIDIGGGYWPKDVDGYYPWMLPAGDITKTAYEEIGRIPHFSAPYYISESVSLAEYAGGIQRAIKKNLMPLGSFEIFAEPGRILSYSAMHIVISVADVKAKDFGIADAGTNMVGEELYEYNYYPMVNLTHHSTKELKFKLFGSLCTPHDVWSYYCYASKMATGDIIAIPNQGAYTYTTAQEFIKGIPPVISLS